MMPRFPDHKTLPLQAPMAASGLIPRLPSPPVPTPFLPRRLPGLMAHRLLLRDLMGPLLRQLARMRLPPLHHRPSNLRLPMDPKEDTIHKLPRASKPAMVLQLNRRTLRPRIKPTAWFPRSYGSNPSPPGPMVPPPPTALDLPSGPPPPRIIPASQRRDIPGWNGAPNVTVPQRRTPAPPIGLQQLS
jgi:hypothetical protein